MLQHDVFYYVRKLQTIPLIRQNNQHTSNYLRYISPPYDNSCHFYYHFSQISNGCLIWPGNFQQTKNASQTRTVWQFHGPLLIPDTCPSFKLNQTTPFHHFISARSREYQPYVSRVDVRVLKTHRKSPLLARPLQGCKVSTGREFTTPPQPGIPNPTKFDAL